MNQPNIDADKWMQDMLNLTRSRGGGQNFDDIRWVDVPSKAKQKLRIRILPGWKTDGVFAKLVYRHYEFEDNPKCLKTWDETCPLCVVIDKYRDKLDAVDKFSSVPYAFMNAQVPDNSDYDQNLAYIFRISPYFLTWLIENMTDREFGYGNVIDPIKGRDVVLWRKRDKGPFERMFHPDGERPIAGSKDGIDNILSTRYDLDAIFKTSPTDDQVKEMKELAARFDKKMADKLGVFETSKSDAVLGGGEDKDCFGSYDGSSGKCVICDKSIECNKKSVDDDIPF